MNFETIIKKLNYNGFNNAKIFIDFNNWKRNFEFKKEEKRFPSIKYWWRSIKNDLKSGEFFDSIKECEESAIIAFLNNYEINER